MKKLILFPLFISFSAMGAGTVQEIPTKQDTDQIVSTVKDLEVKETLEKTKEFNDCRKDGVYKNTDSDSIKSAAIKKAQSCFQKLITNKTNSDELKALSDTLNLQGFGLIKSNNTKEIQEYLNNKMYESLTGVKPDEADKQKLVNSMKFENKKHIDQSLFIRLYKTQLSKNALFEISRYCLNDFRLATDPGPKNFAEYWANFENNLDRKYVDPETKEPKLVFKEADVNDFGSPSFGVSVNDPDKKDDIYADILKSINGTQNGLKTDTLKDFYLACANTMMILCNKYKKSVSVTNIQSDADASASGTTNVGAISCLAKSRIQEIKKALADTEKIEKQFDELATTNKDLLISSMTKGKPIKIFTPGKDGAETIDNLTNFTSYDMLDGKLKGSSSHDVAKDCEKNPSSADCLKLVGNEDDFGKMKNDVEIDMTLKREVEIKRVQQLLKDKDKKIEEYLTEHGYFDLLEKYKDNKLDDKMLEEAIGKEYEARKVATLMEMNRTIGKRQAKSNDDDKTKGAIVDKIVKESKEERARLSQIVMFNNIITSHLDLQRKKADGTFESAGRNVNAWKKEEQALKNEAKVNESLFANLKATDNGQQNGKGIGDEEQLGGIGFIDTLLGKKKDP